MASTRTSCLAGVIKDGGNWEFPKIRCTFFGPHNKDYSILGSILGSLRGTTIVIRVWGLVSRISSFNNPPQAQAPNV